MRDRPRRRNCSSSSGGSKWSWSGWKQVSAVLIPVNCLNLRSRPPRTQRQPVLCAFLPVSHHALIAVATVAGIVAADHGRDRCSLPAWPRLWIRCGPPKSPTFLWRKASSTWWRSWISSPGTCSAGSSRAALTRSSVWRLWRWLWEVAVSQGSYSPIKASSLPRTT